MTLWKRDQHSQKKTRWHSSSPQESDPKGISEIFELPFPWPAQSSRKPERFWIRSWGAFHGLVAQHSVLGLCTLHSCTELLHAPVVAQEASAADWATALEDTSVKPWQHLHGAHSACFCQILSITSSVMVTLSMAKILIESIYHHFSHPPRYPHHHH